MQDIGTPAPQRGVPNRQFVRVEDPVNVSAAILVQRPVMAYALLGSQELREFFAVATPTLQRQSQGPVIRRARPRVEDRLEFVGAGVVQRGIPTGATKARTSSASSRLCATFISFVWNLALSSRSALLIQIGRRLRTLDSSSRVDLILASSSIAQVGEVSARRPNAFARGHITRAARWYQRSMVLP